MRYGRRLRRLVVADGTTWRWNVRWSSTSLTLWVNHDATPRLRHAIAFRSAPGRLADHSTSGYVAGRAGPWLSLHEPGVVRALMDLAAPQLAEGLREIDGWQLYDVLTG
ncbi:hypothetical protein OG389_09765 [Streptomyces sp. NBC_00435]|uniref:hypothetical protein n=1 Tax=Streptomyces sp. NBC_00435 TaxID=2903649 RepID=UPI002E1F0001